MSVFAVWRKVSPVVVPPEMRDSRCAAYHRGVVAVDGLIFAGRWVVSQVIRIIVERILIWHGE